MVVLFDVVAYGRLLMFDILTVAYSCTLQFVVAKSAVESIYM